MEAETKFGSVNRQLYHSKMHTFTTADKNEWWQMPISINPPFF